MDEFSMSEEQKETLSKLGVTESQINELAKLRDELNERDFSNDQIKKLQELGDKLFSSLEENSNPSEVFDDCANKLRSLKESLKRPELDEVTCLSYKQIDNLKELLLHPDETYIELLKKLANTIVFCTSSIKNILNMGKKMNFLIV